MDDWNKEYRLVGKLAIFIHDKDNFVFFTEGCYYDQRNILRANYFKNNKCQLVFAEPMPNSAKLINSNFKKDRDTSVILTKEYVTKLSRPENVRLYQTDTVIASLSVD